MTKQVLCIVSALIAGIIIGTIIAPKESPPQEFHKYDVNQDGIVTPLDSLTITNYLNNQGI